MKEQSVKVSIKLFKNLGNGKKVDIVLDGEVLISNDLTAAQIAGVLWTVEQEINSKTSIRCHVSVKEG